MLLYRACVVFIIFPFHFNYLTIKMKSCVKKITSILLCVFCYLLRWHESKRVFSQPIRTFEGVKIKNKPFESETINLKFLQWNPVNRKFVLSMPFWVLHSSETQTHPKQSFWHFLNNCLYVDRYEYASCMMMTVVMTGYILIPNQT